MANTVIHKKSSVAGKVPLTTDLSYGEFAVNYADSKIYFKNSVNGIEYLTPVNKISGIGISTPLYVDFDLNSSSVAHQRARLWYNPEDDTLNLGHNNNVTQQIGQEFFAPPSLNNSGVVIPNANFVMNTGVQGDKITIAKAVTDGSISPEYMLGIATHDIAVGYEYGSIVTNGIVRDIDTSLWPIGTVLYPNPLVAGGLTSTKPDAPAIRTPVAIVLRQHVSTGRIYVRMQHASTLGGTDSNVKFTSLSDSDLLVYESSTGLWKNKTIDALGLVSGTTSKGFVLYNGTTRLPGTFYGGTENPNGTTRLNYNGYFYPNQLSLVSTADTTDAATHYFVERANDGFIRPKTLANVRAEIVSTDTLGSGTADGGTYLAGDRTWKPFPDASIHIGETAPASPTPGKLWWNSTTATLLVYYYDGDTYQWVETNPSVEGAPGVGVPGGGTAGQVLVKNSNADYDTSWIDLMGFDGSQYNSSYPISVPAGASGNQVPRASEVALLAHTNLTIKNYLNNSKFDVTARGTGGTSANTYFTNRWISYHLGTAHTASIVTGGILDGIYFNNLAAFSGASGNTATRLTQRIHSSNSTRLVGKKVTLSAYVLMQNTGSLNTVQLELNYPNTKDNWASTTLIAAQNVTILSGVWTRVSFTTVLPQIDAVEKGLSVDLYTSGIPSGGVVYYTGIQLEEGELSKYEALPVEMDYANCEKYWRTISLSGLRIIGSAAGAGHHLSWVFSAPGDMIKTPTITSSLGVSSSAGVSTNPTALDSTANTYVVYVISNAATGLVDFTFNSSAKIIFDAEV